MGALVMLTGISAAIEGFGIASQHVAAATNSSFFMAERSVCMPEPASHDQPEMEEQGVVVAGADAGAVELIVECVVDADARIGPRPARRLAGAERDIRELGNPAVAVGDQVRVQYWIGRAPGVEILPGQHYSVVRPIGDRRQQTQ